MSSTSKESTSVNISGSSVVSRRQRGRRHDFITKNACRECRKKKAKCDGQEPCSQCARTKGLTCEYDVSIHVRKEAMRAEIKHLQIYRRCTEHILRSLALGHQSELILQQIRGGLPPEQISSSMNPYSRLEDDGQKLRLGGTFESQGSYSRWTELTSNDVFIDHLVSLYFCWEYPTFATISKNHFLEDFEAGRQRYCSSLLVNAVLALGCKFSDRPEARAHPGDAETAGMQFYAESERLLALERDHPSLTTIQAVGLMSIYNVSHGRHSKSCFYASQSICLAIEMGLHVHIGNDNLPKDEHEVRLATFWGAFTLDQTWSLILGRLPHTSFAGVGARKPTIIDVDEQNQWVPYTDDGIYLGKNQPSNVLSISQSFRELAEVIHHALYVVYAPIGTLTSQAILDVYTTYLQWHIALPIALRLGENSTPAVLFAHLYYHFAILLLFRPFIGLRILGSSISPSEVCIEAADAVSSLVDSYRRLYSLRRTPPFLTYIILTSGVVHLSAAASDAVNIRASMRALQDCNNLQEMVSCHSFAERARQSLRIRAQDSSKAVSLTRGMASAEGKKNPQEPLTGLVPNNLTDDSIFYTYPIHTRPIIASKGSAGTEIESLC